MMDKERRAILQASAIGAAMAGVNSFLPHALAHNASTSGNSMHDRSITDLSRSLSEGKITSRQLVDEALAAINDPNGEGKPSFIKVHAEKAKLAADAIDAKRKQGHKLPVLAGIPISVKDLFDEAGETTLGGSTVLIGQPAATKDSVVVQRLREAGAIIIGRTNTVEFAYTGLGINPHYGTPKNVFDRATGRIPGGSTSGGAISVTDGMAAGAIGTDTGGSLRIPAALNGLVGFKPTQRRVTLDGVMPLSTSFDSAGPIGWTVEDCILLDSVIADQKLAAPKSLALKNLRFAVPQVYFQNDLSPEVANAFHAALSKLSAAGAKIVELPMAEFEMTPTINPKGMITASEAYAWHRKFLKDGADKYDPRVLARIKTGEIILAADYVDLQTLRRQFIRNVNAAAAGYDAMLMPTTPDIAPPIAEVIKDDEAYYRINGRMLRNPSAVNIFDGCALSVPCHEAGNAPVGLMIAGIQNQDQHILAVGRSVESVVGPSRRR
ncbi:amidase [Phyllobacterium sp. TAF24]|uniref:amidase n=1 Tax=Phyllobacterium sp. TAF24 TaxID=3233068 RepID=UPI003F97EBD7